ncbi:MAG: glycosyltransferase family 4 protein [Thermoplasmatales archaeon]|nr:glycosyltransferase family 4 protein [Thermoplasmatales archaeon]
MLDSGETMEASKKRVAIVGSPDLEFYGGTQVDVIQLANLLSESGYEVTIYGSGTYFRRREVDLRKGIQYFRNSFGFDPFSFHSILTLTSGVSEPLIGMFTAKRISRVVGAYDAYYITAPKFVLYALTKYVIRNQPVVIGNYGTYIEYLMSRENFISKSLINLFDSIFLKYAKSKNYTIHALNTVQRDHYLKMGIDASNIFIIPQCDVDFSKFKVRDNDQFRVLFLNRLSNDKGAHLIPDIANDCKDIEFVVIGDGPLMGLLKEKCGSNVRLTGFLSEEDKEDEVGKCDALLNLSRYESLSISSIEGIASGLTVVSRNKTSGLSLIQDKVRESVLFGEGTAGSISSIIRKIKGEKENDKRQFLEKKLRIRSTGESVFDKRVVTSEMLELVRYAFSAESAAP